MTYGCDMDRFEMKKFNLPFTRRFTFLQLVYDSYFMATILALHESFLKESKRLSLLPQSQPVNTYTYSEFFVIIKSK